MTDLRYLDDPYDQRFEATVSGIADDRITLDRTLFYPEGGGQPADRGVITEPESGQRWRVSGVERTDVIYHHLASDGPVPDSGERNTAGEAIAAEEGTIAGGGDDPGVPAAGTTVEGELDWERRYAHMRYHTAQHLLSALLLKEYDAETTGNQLYADRARIDVGYDRFEEGDLDAVEAGMNDLVSEARPVEWYEMDRESAEANLDPERTRLELLPEHVTDVRIVEIEGYDRVACAGTHVRNTEEVGEVTVTGRETRGSGGERLRFVLDT